MHFTLLSLLALPQFPRIIATSSAERLQSLPLEEVKKINYHQYIFPEESVFPGPWEENIKAPVNKTHIFPQKIFRWDGDVSEPDALLDGTKLNRECSLRPYEFWLFYTTRLEQDQAILTFKCYRGNSITVEFTDNIAGR